MLKGGKYLFSYIYVINDLTCIQLHAYSNVSPVSPVSGLYDLEPSKVTSPLSTPTSSFVPPSMNATGSELTVVSSTDAETYWDDVVLTIETVTTHSTKSSPGLIIDQFYMNYDPGSWTWMTIRFSICPERIRRDF